MIALLADMKSMPTDGSSDGIAPEINDKASGEDSEDNEVRLVQYFILFKIT